MPINNANRAVLNDRGEETSFQCTYHIVSDVYDTEYGLTFVVKSYENQAASSGAAAIAKSFNCPVTASAFPFSEEAQAQDGVTLRTLVEEELLKPAEVSDEGRRDYAFRGYLFGGTIV